MVHTDANSMPEKNISVTRKRIFFSCLFEFAFKSQVHGDDFSLTNKAVAGISYGEALIGVHHGIYLFSDCRYLCRYFRNTDRTCRRTDSGSAFYVHHVQP